MYDLRKGQTGINEHARRVMDISRDEYAFCSYVHYRQADTQQTRRGFCCDSKQDVADFVGISRAGLYKMIDRMVAAKLMDVQPNGDLSTLPRFTQIETNGKETFQNKIKGGVNKVDTECKQSRQPGVNLVTGNKEVLVRKEIEEDRSIMSESENSDGVTFKMTIHEAVTIPVEATPKSEKPPVPNPPRPVEIPKRDNNDPRPHLEATRKNLLIEFEVADNNYTRELIKVRGIKAANEIKLEDNIDAVVARLNEKGQFPRGYRADKKETRSAIRKRLKEYSVDDLYTVVDFKCRQWKDDAKLRQYLRPDTLFNGHFEDYLNAALLDKQNPLQPKDPNQAAYTSPASVFNPDKYKPVYRAEDAPKSTRQPAIVD